MGRLFLSFVRKEMMHILRDVRTMLLLLGLPVAMIVLFGFAITTEVKNGRMAVCNPSPDATSERIIAHFEASEYFTITHRLSNADQTDDLFKRGEIDVALVLSNGFADDMLHSGDASVQVITDASDPNTASTLAGYAQAVLRVAQQSMAVDNGAQVSVPFQIIPQTQLLYNPSLKSSYLFVPGIMGLILMLICAMMTSVSIVREKELGTMELLLVSPVNPMVMIMAKLVPYMLISIFNLVSILLLSRYLLGVPFLGSYMLFVGVSTLYILVALSFGLLISTVVDTQIAALLISGMGLMMPTMLLSGMIFPIENMPWILQQLSSIIPARWYIVCVRGIMIQGVSAHYLITEIATLGLMWVVLMSVSVRKFSNRLE